MKLDDMKKLHLKRYREEFGHFLVEGEHGVLELEKAALHRAPLQACELYVTASHEQWRSAFKTHLISASQMSQLAETHNPQGIVALVPILPATPASAGERAIYLYEIQDPGNLGTILRTLGWFGGYRCLLSPGSVDPYNPKAVRASAGGIFHVPIETEVPLRTLRERFARIASLDMHGESVAQPQFRRNDCYVFGNEARGLPREELDAPELRAYAIGGAGTIESLNLASAVNMCVYELSRPDIP